MGDSLRWIGHSTVLVELDGVRLLTDPRDGRYPDIEIRALVDSLSERPASEGDENPGTRSA